MLRVIVSLLAALPLLEADVEGLVNEIKDGPGGLSVLKNALSAIEALATHLRAALGE